MRKIIIRKIAVYVLLFFSWSILTNGVNFADNGDKDSIAKAEQLFNDMQYDDAIKTLNDFLAVYKSKDNEKSNISHKLRIAKAYSLLARIYFSISETEHKEKILENIKNSLKYNINHKVKTVNKDFEKLYNKIKDEHISQRQQTKPVEKKIISRIGKRKKKKKFPVLLVLVGVAVVAVAVVLLLKKKKSDPIPERLAIPESERAALIAFYNSTGGGNWDINFGWKDGELEPDGFGPIGSEGNWVGITVVDYHVTEINLGDSDLRGIIPDQIGDLSYLTFLNLESNFLTGNIPASIGNLINLEFLGLSMYTNLTGSIPSSIGNLTKLKTLWLSPNLTGNIPDFIVNLKNLEDLDLSGNKLTGSIPSAIGNLTNLKWLYLNFNQLTGSIPMSIGDLTNLSSLYLDHNKLSGEIPSTITNLSNITRVSIDFNCLWATVSATISWLNSKSSDWNNNQNQCN